MLKSISNIISIIYINKVYITLLEKFKVKGRNLMTVVLGVLLMHTYGGGAAIHLTSYIEFRATVNCRFHLLDTGPHHIQPISKIAPKKYLNLIPLEH